MLNFDESFFNAEEIDGFYVRSMMKRYWASSMECLAELDRICKKNGIRYFAYYGTLLGAVRHKGYIPWDDDMDIVMIREDYDRFIKACEKDADHDMFILYNVNKSSVYPMRFTNTLYARMDEPFLERFHKCPYPSGLDIYVLDKVPSIPKEAEAVKLLHQIVRYMAQRTDNLFEKTHGDALEVVSEEDLEMILSGIEEFTGEKFIRDDTLYEQLTKLAHRIASMYNNTHSDYYARIINWAISGDAEKLPIEWFKETVYLPFHDMMIPCPKYYHEVLVKTMGENYMTPIKFLNAHAYPCFKKPEAELLEIFRICGAEAPGYLFE